MKLVLKEDPAEWRKLVLFQMLGFSLLTGLLTWRRVLPQGGCVPILGVLASIAVVACLRPRWFRGWYRVMSRFAHRMTHFLGQCALVVIFFLLVVPLGWALRLFGQDLLRLRRDRKAVTYWKEARPPGPLDGVF